MRYFSRNAYKQSVSRTERFNIELTACIFNTFSRKRIKLDFAVVSCCHGCNTAHLKVIKDCDSKGSTFCRVSSGTNLIKSTRQFSSASLRILTVLVMCDENVLKLCSILCSSPISAYIFLNTAMSEWSRAGMNKPDCAISVRSPTVFNETVLPPVLGPVMIRSLKSVPR